MVRYKVTTELQISNNLINYILTTYGGTVEQSNGTVTFILDFATPAAAQAAKQDVLGRLITAQQQQQ